MPISPSSPTELRLALKGRNAELFKSILRRRATVEKIQSLKTSTPSAWASFDAQRERDLFSQMHTELTALGPKELLAFSLLMEAHAGAPEQYPAWSEGVHLIESPLQDFHRTNPLMLKLLRPELFAALRLRPNFAFLHDS
mgnify:FL=1